VAVPVQGIAAMNMTHFGVHHQDGSAQSDRSVHGHGRHCRRLLLGFRRGQREQKGKQQREKREIVSR